MKSFLKFMLVVLIWFVICGLCVAGAVLSQLTVEDGLIIFGIIFVTWYTVKLVIFLIRRFIAQRQVRKLINIEKPESDKARWSAFEIFKKRDVDKHLARVLPILTKLRGAPAEDGAQRVKIAMHLKFDNRDSFWLDSKTCSKPQSTDPVLTEFGDIRWRLFNRFVVLDVDAPLANDDSPASQGRWFSLLDGLSYYRKDAPIDAVIVSLDGEHLKDEDSRVEIADRVRQLYGNIVDRCAIDAPVSVVITGGHNLSDLEDWASDLDAGIAKKAFGKVNSNGQNATELVSDIFAELKSVYRNSSLVNLVKRGFSSSTVRAANGASELEKSLEHTLSRLFAHNNFSLAPSLAGLFFVARKPGHVSFADGLLEESTLVWKAPRAMGVRTEADARKARMQFFYRAACAALAGLTFLIYLMAYRTIDVANTSYRIAVSEGDSVESIVKNLRARLGYVESLEGLMLGHWLPLSDDPLELRRNEALYLRDLENRILKPLDEALFEEMTEIDSVEVSKMELLVRRINLLEAAIQGESLTDLELLPQVYEANTLPELTEELTFEINDLYLRQFVLGREVDSRSALVRWNTEKGRYQRELSKLLVASNGRMDWVLDWVRMVEQPADITLKTYWAGNLEASEAVVVDGVYTLEGKALVETFINDLALALDLETDFFEQYLPSFLDQYEKNYIAAWGSFLSRFNEGRQTLGNRADWLEVINDLPTGRNIFFNVLNDAEFQLSPYLDNEELPEWIEFIVYYQDMLALGADQLQSNAGRNNVLTKLGLKLLSKTGAVGAAVAKSAKSGLKTQKKLDKASGAGPGPDERELNLQTAATELDNYKAQIAAVAFNVEQRTASYDSIRGYFLNAENPTAAGTALAELQKSIVTLESLIGRPSAATAAFWNVYIGAADLMRAFMLEESSCVVNDRWEDQYLFDIYGIPDYKLSEIAFSETGTLWQFTDQELAPFLQRKPGLGYSAKRIGEEAIPFEAGLFEYLYKAQDMRQQIVIDQVRLNIRTKPTSLNRKALLLVAKTELELSCEAGGQSLSNINILDEGIFDWEPSCKSIDLRFEIGNRIVEKSYTGIDGLQQFLTDFSEGRHTYQIEEFPDFFYLLKQFQIEEITANIEIDGASRLMLALANRPPMPLNQIAACWN